MMDPSITIIVNTISFWPQLTPSKQWLDFWVEMVLLLQVCVLFVTVQYIKRHKIFDWCVAGYLAQW